MNRQEVQDAVDLAAWLREQMAADETAARAVLYKWRNEPAGRPYLRGQLADIEGAKQQLAVIESDRNQLDVEIMGAKVGDAELRAIREIGLKYQARDGYQEKWRP